MKQSERHDEALAFIRSYAVRGYAPSRRELASELGMSLSTAQQLIEDLIEQGLLERAPKIARSLVIGANMKHGEVTL